MQRSVESINYQHSVISNRASEFLNFFIRFLTCLSSICGGVHVNACAPLYPWAICKF